MIADVGKKSVSFDCRLLETVQLQIYSSKDNTGYGVGKRKIDDADVSEKRAAKDLPLIFSYGLLTAE
jgi:hypothetical protein